MRQLFCPQMTQAKCQGNAGLSLMCINYVQVGCSHCSTQGTPREKHQGTTKLDTQVRNMQTMQHAKYTPRLSEVMESRLSVIIEFLSPGQRRQEVNKSLIEITSCEDVRLVTFVLESYLADFSC